MIGKFPREFMLYSLIAYLVRRKGADNISTIL